MQSKTESAKEQIVRMAINWLLSSLSYIFLFPGSNFYSNFVKALYFIPLSFAVGYCVRRFYEKQKPYK
jgi:hypothetical protein